MIQRIGAAHGRGDLKTVFEYFATSLLVMAAIAFIITLVAIAVSLYVPSWMGLTGNEATILRNCFTVAAISASLNIFANGIIGFSRGVQDTKLISIMVVVAGVIGFGVSLCLVLAGKGLWAITLGLVARNTTVFAGSIIFGANSLRKGLHRFFRPRLSMLREFSTILPVTALSGIGYTVMTQSESAIVAIVLRPELAVVLTLTRKTLEIGRGLIDMIAFATYGGFAHLVASDQRHRTLRVHAEIISLRLSLALVAAAAYMAVNASLITVWVGASQYGGPLLTILMAFQFIIVGGSFLLNYLYRAAGSIMQGSLALLMESAIRVPLMIVLVSWLGLPGIPIAGIVTGGLFSVLAYRWTLKLISCFAEPSPRTPMCVWGARAIVLAIGMLFCVFVKRNSWAFVGVIGSIMVTIGGVILLSVDPLLSSVRGSLVAVSNRFQLLIVRHSKHSEK
jgi:O-antigen/teichoic acid export membrane protein